MKSSAQTSPVGGHDDPLHETELAAKVVALRRGEWPTVLVEQRNRLAAGAVNPHAVMGIDRRVAYLGAADIVSRPLPIRLREVKQPVIIT